MADVEIELENAMPWWETLPDGRRAIVIEDEYTSARKGGNGPRVLLILPQRGAWSAAHMLALVTEKIYNEVRAAERGDVHRGGGRIITAPDPDVP